MSDVSDVRLQTRYVLCTTNLLQIAITIYYQNDVRPWSNVRPSYQNNSLFPQNIKRQSKSKYRQTVHTTPCIVSVHQHTRLIGGHSHINTNTCSQFVKHASSNSNLLQSTTKTNCNDEVISILSIPSYLNLILYEWFWCPMRSKPKQGKDQFHQCHVHVRVRA